MGENSEKKSENFTPETFLEDYICEKKFVAPINGKILKKFQNEKNSIRGISIKSSEKYIKSIEEGVIVFSTKEKEKYITIVNHPDGFLSIYQHFGTPQKSVGSTVKSGETLAILEKNSDFSDLDFYLIVNLECVDPEQYINFSNNS